MNLEIINDDIHNVFIQYLSNLKDSLFKQKKICAMYLILIIISSLSLFTMKNYKAPFFEISMIVLISILGLWAICDYTYRGNAQMHKTVFIMLLVFGLISCFTMPIGTVSDGGEHFTRAEITSQGVIFPHYEKGGGFKTIQSIKDLNNLAGKTVFNTKEDTHKINFTSIHIDSAFEQNPFYGYLFSGLGVLIAKLLNLNAIWMLWLGRIFNTLFFATTISYAIKKTPILKIPLTAIACLPVCLFQAFSVSIDSIMAALGILAVAYFFYMIVNKFELKDLFIFMFLCLLAGLCKLPTLGLIFLMFFIPTQNFKTKSSKEYYLYCAIGFIIVALIALVWSRYSTQALAHSWRMEDCISHNVDMTNQINSLLTHKYNFITNMLSFIPNSIYTNFNSLFTFYYKGPYEGSAFVSILLTLFLGFICLGYPIENKIPLKTRIGAFLSFIIVYIGIYMSFLLIWTPVGQFNHIKGVHSRYFLTIFPLLPLICSLNLVNKKEKKFDYYIFGMTVFFISAMIISLILKYY